MHRELRNLLNDFVGKAKTQREFAFVARIFAEQILASFPSEPQAQNLTSSKRTRATKLTFKSRKG